MNKKQTTAQAMQENPEPLELIADSIIQIAAAYEKINASRLQQRVIVLLIKDQCKSISLFNIEQVLNTVPKLKDYYLKKLKV